MSNLHTMTEYDAMTGYVTGEYVSEWTGRDGTLWRTLTTVINLGRPDRGQVADPDHIDRPAQLPASGGLRPDAAIAATKRAGLAREQAACLRIEGLLRERGPMNVSALSNALGIWRGLMRKALRANPDKFVPVGAKKEKWGLVGVTYPDAPKRDTSMALAMRAYLLACGPSTRVQIQAALGVSDSSVYLTIKGHPHYFCIVGATPVENNIASSRIYGLVGIHDQEAVSA